MGICKILQAILMCKMWVDWDLKIDRFPKLDTVITRYEIHKTRIWVFRVSGFCIICRDIHILASQPSEILKIAKNHLSHILLQNIFTKPLQILKLWPQIWQGWFSVGICKYKPGYKSHDHFNSSTLIGWNYSIQTGEQIL